MKVRLINELQPIFIPQAVLISSFNHLFTLEAFAMRLCLYASTWVRRVLLSRFNGHLRLKRHRFKSWPDRTVPLLPAEARTVHTVSCSTSSSLCGAPEGTTRVWTPLFLKVGHDTSQGFDNKLSHSPPFIRLTRLSKWWLLCWGSGFKSHSVPV